MSSAASTSVVPSRAALPSGWQTHLSSLCHLRARGNAKTSLAEIPPVRTLRTRARPDRCVVHPRTAKSRRVGLRDPVHLRGVALPRNLSRPLPRLRQHLAENQARSQRVAPMGGRGRNQTPTVHMRVL